MHRLMMPALAGLGLMMLGLPAAPYADDSIVPSEQVALNPDSFIESLGADAVEGLTGPELSRAERERRLRAMLNRNFDLAAIGKFVLGRYWGSATPAEQADFLQLFEDFVVQIYAARFGDYAGESFEVLNAADNQGGDPIVRSRIIRGDAEPIRVDWRLRHREGGFVVTDIIVEGVSMAMTQRSEFASVIQSNGGSVAGLLDALRQKTRQSDGQDTAQ